MKILHVITSLYTGGAEKLMVDLLPRLKAKGHDVDLLLFDGTNTPFREDVEAAGIKVYDLGKGGSVYSPIKLLKLIPYLRKYDIVHTHNYAPQLFAAIGGLFSSVKLITTEHNTSNRRRIWKWYAFIDCWMYSRYNRVICISKKAEENLRQFIGDCNTKIITINNGIDIAKYATAEPSPILEALAPGSRKIIMVAGFRKQKDQDTLIKSLKFLPEKFHLFLVGDGERREECENLAISQNMKDRVHFLGIRKDIPELLHAADYVVMSSHFEGLSLSSVEGMSVGKPFLASDVDGLREVVGNCCILFSFGDFKTIANEILDLEENISKYTTIAKQSSSRAKNFDISLMVDEYVDMYKNIKIDSKKISLID